MANDEWLELARERCPYRFSPDHVCPTCEFAARLAREASEATDAYVKAVAIEQGRLNEWDWEELNESHQRAIVARLREKGSGK
jgi:hypothetical protein